jgi:UDP-N-acetylmuramoyl-tripeptide--D-alanyl-D-alanine ligase
LVRNGLAGVPLAMLGVRRGQAHAVLEVGIDHAGQMSRHSRTLQPDVAVITAVGSEHQIGLGSLATTQREKACLLEGLRRPGLAVLNGDDPRVRAMAAWTDARVVTYGCGRATCASIGRAGRGSRCMRTAPHGRSGFSF